MKKAIKKMGDELQIDDSSNTYTGSRVRSFDFEFAAAISNTPASEWQLEANEEAFGCLGDVSGDAAIS